MKFKGILKTVIWTTIWSPIMIIFFGGNFMIGMILGNGNNIKAFIISILVWLINNSVRKMLLNRGYGL